MCYWEGKGLLWSRRMALRIKIKLHLQVGSFNSSIHYSPSLQLSTELYEILVVSLGDLQTPEVNYAIYCDYLIIILIRILQLSHFFGCTAQFTTGNCMM